MITHRAPPTAKLATIEAYLAGQLAYRSDHSTVSNELVLALVQFALAHGAVTVSDLTPGKLNAG